MARSSDPIANQIRAATAALRGANRAVAKLAATIRRIRTAPRSTRTAALSPKRLAALKLHGAYIGHLRHLKPKQKAQVRAVKAKQGYEAAIAAARKVVVK